MSLALRAHAPPVTKTMVGLQQHGVTTGTCRRRNVGAIAHKLLFLLAAVACYSPCVLGHGLLLDPPSRNWKAYKAVRFDWAHALTAGGVWHAVFITLFVPQMPHKRLFVCGRRNKRLDMSDCLTV